MGVRVPPLALLTTDAYVGLKAGGVAAYRSTMLSKNIEGSAVAGRDYLEKIQISLHEIDPVHVRVDITVPPEVVRAKTDERLAALAPQAQVPGFRRGRVPRPILEKHFGSQIKREIELELVTESIDEAARRYDLRLTGGIRLESASLSDAGTFTCVAVLEVFPKISEVHYEGLEVTVRPVSIGEEDVDRAIEQLRERHVTLVPIEDRDTVQAGDVVAVTVRQPGTQHGAENESQTLVWLQEPVDPDSSVAALVGRHVGETVAVTARSPERTGQAQLVKIEKIYRRNVPPLDDEFAKTVSNAETLAELRSLLRSEIEAHARRRQNAAIEAELRRALAAANPQVIPPPTLVSREREQLAAAWTVQTGLPLAKARELLEHTPELAKRLEDEARSAVVSHLLLQAIADAKGIVVTEDEIESVVDQLAKSRGIHEQEVRRAYEREDVRARALENMRLSRALEIVRQSARVRELEEPSQIAADTRNG